MASASTAAGACTLRAVSKTFQARSGPVEALSRVDLTISSGEFLCVVGPSGCGKTTLLNILADLEQPSSGSVTFNLLPSGSLDKAMVFQEQGVFPWMTVLDNAAFGLRARHVSREARERIARAMLDQVGLAGFESAYPYQLSGGMRQRVNLARAFASDPQMLLMDEPFANLDEQTKLILQDELLRIWEQSRKTVVFITHSVDEAIRLGDRIVVMSARPGSIKADVSVDLPRPRDVFELQNDPSFIRVRAEVWRALKDEVLALRSVRQ
jgi:NitT/TauT family transport system ATP-binding protein